MHHSSTRELAFKLRREGFAYSYIARKTGLSKSTLSGWLSDVPYHPNPQTVKRIGRAIAAANEKKIKTRQEETEEIRKSALLEIGKMSKRDVFMYGLGLYLGEGSKTQDITRVVNSDPNVICLAIAWFYELGVLREQFTIRIHLYPDSDIERSLQFWSRITNIPRSQFSKVQIDTRLNKRKYKAGKLPNGTAHLSVNGFGRKEYGVVFARRIQAWNDGVARVIKKRA